MILELLKQMLLKLAVMEIFHILLIRIWEDTILEEEGLPEIAPICERHLGTGLTVNDIVDSNFPLPHRDMTPKTLEEKLICYADKFYSKSDKHLTVAKTPEKIRKKILKYGEDKLKTFEEFVDLFGIDYIYK